MVNTLENAVPGSLELTIGLDGDTVRLDQTVATSELSAGKTLVQSAVNVADWRLWDLDSPTLYSVTARLTTPATGRRPDVASVRCGFRDFRFENGYFRLNGKRLYVRSALTANHAPVGIYVPYDHGTKPDLIQRGMLEAKRLGFNMVRFIGSMPRKNVVDYCDEIGLMLHVESMASFGSFKSAPKTAETKERFDHSIREMILRDRNNPSVVIWGILNETPLETSGYEYALKSLPLVRKCDPSRFVLFSSGRWDKNLGVGSGSNPGSTEWDVYLGDEHPGGTVAGGSMIHGRVDGMGDVHHYPRVPHNFEAIQLLRNLGKGLRNRVFLSEYGVGSGQHLPKILALHEQHGGRQMEIHHWFADMNDKFMRDWRAWRLDEMYAAPNDYFDASLAAMAQKRQIGLDAVRANPNLVGHAVTSLCDLPTSGEGVLDSERRPKPGMVEVMNRAWAPLRLCAFVEPYNLYRGREIQIEAVLVNEDVLGAGSHRTKLSIVDQTGRAVWSETAACTVPEGEPPLAMPFYSRKITADWPAGEYRFVAQFTDGKDGKDGHAVFHVGEKSRMPAVKATVALWGRDDPLHAWLKDSDIQTTPYSLDAPKHREVILVGRDRPADFTHEAFLELARRVARGSTVVFASDAAWTDDKDKKGNKAILWPPLRDNPDVSVREMPAWLYLTDFWAKNHAVFANMPAGGILDHVYYRELLLSPLMSLTKSQAPAEAIAGGIDTSAIFSGGYHSGLTLASFQLGAGYFFINTLSLCENLGKAPAAELLLRNLLNYASRDLSMPLSDLAPSIDQMLRERVLALRELELPPAGVTLLEEKFDSPSASGWKTAGGSWQVGEGRYRQTDNQGRAVAYFAGGRDWKDYMVSAEVSGGGLGNSQNAGLCFRVSNDGQDAYVLRFLDTGRMSVGLIQGGRWHEQGSFPFTSDSGRMYTLTVLARGSDFGLFADGVRIGGFRNDTLKQGTVGLYTYRKATSFGPVHVTELQEVP